MSKQTEGDGSGLPEALRQRYAEAQQIVTDAAATALEYFRNLDKLGIEVKGLQDWVSDADKSVETQIRDALSAVFPEDSIVGEEHGTLEGSSGYTWVIDPIDGTTNFITGTPGWCVVLACLLDDQVVCAAVCDPVSRESFSAAKEQGAWLNGRKLQCSAATAINQGTLGVGHNTRVAPQSSGKLLNMLLEREGLFRRSGSGALDLAYVSAGRLIGYVEPHMNAWDCLASLLLIEEAGGVIEPYDMQGMMSQGGRVVVACPGVYDEVLSMTAKAYG